MKTITLVGVAALSLAAPISAQTVPEAKVAVVDIERISRECTACRAATAQIQAQATTLRTRAQTLNQQLQTAGAPIQTAVNALAGKQPDAALQARLAAFRTQENNAAQEIQRGEQNLRSITANVQQQIGSRLQPIVNSVMQRRGANVAVDQGSTLAHASQLNITTDVLTELNRQLPSVSVTPLPTQAAPAQQQPRPQGR